MFDFDFTARIWRYSSSSGGGGGEAASGSWYFITLPLDVSREIHSASKGKSKPGGSLRVTVTIGGTRWKTSIFRDQKRGAYLLPIKAAVRAKEQLREGDAVEAAILLEI